MGEAELEEIDAVAKPDQTLAQLEGSDLAPRRGSERLDGLQQPVDPVSLSSPSHIPVL